MESRKNAYNGSYADEHLDRVAFPLGGIGAGMICLEGGGAISHFSLRHKPEVFHEPLVFSALTIKGASGNTARILEGPVPSWKIFFPWAKSYGSAGGGLRNKTYGLPHFAQASFQARFPFATVSLQDTAVPLNVKLTGWSPFLPGNADDSSLPVAALEYSFHNPTQTIIEAVYSFHAQNFMKDASLDQLPKEQRTASQVRRTAQGFILGQTPNATQPWSEGTFSASTDAPGTAINCRWFRGGWFDPATLVWKSIVESQLPDTRPYTEGEASQGGSLYVPLTLQPGETKTIRLRLAWHVPNSQVRTGKGLDDEAEAAPTPSACGCEGKCPPPAPKETYRAWYAGKFSNVEAVDTYWLQNYKRLRDESQRFADCFYDTTLPAEVVDAVSANLAILKSPTVMRQADGRAWLWEGCNDDSGCCDGSCTHVWNYAQALAHLFPDLERSLRDTEFTQSQNPEGHQNFRSCLPIRPSNHKFHAAADGQLGGIMKVHRDWRISGDTAWLRKLWPNIKQSLDYCISTWDPNEEGQLKEPHHNTYDIEFWGPDGMCNSFYLGALTAMCAMGKALGEPVERYTTLAGKSKVILESELFDGEYFIQKIQWTGLRAADPVSASVGAWNGGYSPEAQELLQAEGPKYQYGIGCLSDGVLGEWISVVCGVGAVLDPTKIRSHLQAVHRYNFRTDLSTHANVQRPGYALGKEAGLLLCSWPKGGRLTLPFVYSEEVWTGIEYQVASHLMLMGCVDEGLQIVRAVRDRYDGRIRNPFNEYECGSWYGRALASYGLLQGMTGQRYDAITRTLHLHPQIKGDWRAFLCTAEGYGTVGMRGGKPFIEVKHGKIPVDHIEVEQ